MVGASLSQPPLSQPAKWSKTSACGDVDMVYQLPPDPGLHTREVRLGCIGGSGWETWPVGAMHRWVGAAGRQSCVGTMGRGPGWGNGSSRVAQPRNKAVAKIFRNEVSPGCRRSAQVGQPGGLPGRAGR